MNNPRAPLQPLTSYVHTHVIAQSSGEFGLGLYCGVLNELPVAFWKLVNSWATTLCLEMHCESLCRRRFMSTHSWSSFCFGSDLKVAHQASFVHTLTTHNVNCKVCNQGRKSSADGQVKGLRPRVRHWCCVITRSPHVTRSHIIVLTALIKSWRCRLRFFICIH